MMNPAPPDDDLLIAFLRGELGDAERIMLEDRLDREPDLRRKLAETADALAALQHVRRHALRHRLGVLDRNARRTRLALAASAVITLLLCMIFLRGC